MNQIKAILVDDEESARDILENLLKRFCPEVTLLGKYSNLLDAVESIKNHQPDLVFLDIEMPNYAGFEIVNLLENISFEIIFVTAYDKYALRAFEIAALDYLLKPIDLDRLKEAVSRVMSSFNIQQNEVKLNLLKSTLQEKEIKNIIISEKGNQQVLPLNEIIALEAQESYCFIHTLNKRFTVSKNLKYFENILNEIPSFIRVHKSWIISKNHVISYSKSDFSILLTNHISAKLSKYKKTDFEEAILR